MNSNNISFFLIFKSNSYTIDDDFFFLIFFNLPLLELKWWNYKLAMELLWNIIVFCSFIWLGMFCNRLFNSRWMRGLMQRFMLWLIKQFSILLKFLKFFQKYCIFIDQFVVTRKQTRKFLLLIVEGFFLWFLVCRNPLDDKTVF